MYLINNCGGDERAVGVLMVGFKGTSDPDMIYSDAIDRDNIINADIRWAFSSNYRISFFSVYKLEVLNVPS